MKWIQVYDHILGEKHLRAKLDVAIEERKKLLKEMKKFLKVLKRETPENKVARNLKLQPPR